MSERKPVPTWHVIGRGMAGWHASGVNTSSSGGDLDPHPKRSQRYQDRHGPQRGDLMGDQRANRGP